MHNEKESVTVTNGGDTEEKRAKKEGTKAMHFEKQTTYNHGRIKHAFFQTLYTIIKMHIGLILIDIYMLSTKYRPLCPYSLH